MTEQENAEMWVFVALAFFGATGFGVWMHSGGAFAWCFATFLLIACYVSDFTKATKK